jgi:hypothetical protein
VPSFEGWRFQRSSSPAEESTRYTLAGLAATTSSSSIMNVRRRYPSSGFFPWKSMIARRSQASSQ